MPSTTPSKVLIVGAGPVGLVLACELHRNGVPFRIIDKSSAPTTISKALGIHARTLEVFEQMGVIEPFLTKGVHVHALNLHAQGKRKLHISFEDINSPFNFAISLAQSDTEHFLIEHLAKNGIHVERQTECLDLKDNGTSVIATLKKANAEAEQVEFAYVVGCDGAHSTVRKVLNLPFEGAEYAEAFALGDFHIKADFPLDEWHLFLHSNGLCAIFAMDKSRIRAIASIGKDHQGPVDLDYFKRIFKQRQVNGIKSCYDPIWFSEFHIHRRMVPKMNVGRVFIAGDAAHIHSPAGGQGMNTGIQDAFNLAWKLAYVLKEASPKSILDSYTPERHPVAEEVLHMTHRMTRMMMTQSTIIQKLRNFLLPLIGEIHPLKEQLLESIEELHVHYRCSPITQEYVDHKLEHEIRHAFTIGPYAGDRAPDATVSQVVNNKPTKIFDLLKGTSFKLFIFITHSEGESCVQAINNLLDLVNSRYYRVVTPMVITKNYIPDGLIMDKSNLYSDHDSDAFSKYGTNSCSIYLIRPDNYIAYRSLSLDVDRLEDYLEGILI